VFFLFFFLVHTGVNAPTGRSARWVTSCVFTLNSAGLIERWTMENDRFGVLEQLGWPLHEHLPDSSYLGKIKGHVGTGVKVLQLSEQHKKQILDAPRRLAEAEVLYHASPVTGGLTDLEKSNLQVVSKFNQLFHEHGNKSFTQRMEEMFTLVNPSTQYCWMNGSPSRTILQFAMENEGVINCAPDMKVESEGGFAKGELVFSAVSFSATASKGPLPFGQEPANHHSVFNGHTYAIVRQGRIDAYWIVWNKGLVFGPVGQFGVALPPNMPDAPYVSPGKVLTNLGITVDSASSLAIDTKYRRNEGIVKEYIEKFYNGAAADGKLDRTQFEHLTDFNGPFHVAAFPSVQKIVDHFNLVDVLFPLIKQRKIAQIDKLWAVGNIVVMHGTMEMIREDAPVVHAAPHPAQHGHIIVQSLPPAIHQTRWNTSILFRIGDDGRINAILQELDALPAFEALGLPPDPSMKETHQVGGELYKRWEKQIKLMQEAADAGVKPSVDEMAARGTLEKYTRICLDRNVAYAPPLVTSLISTSGGGDLMHVDGFSSFAQTHLGFAAGMVQMNATGPDGYMLPAVFTAARGNNAILLFAGKAAHTGANYFSSAFPATGRTGLFTAAMNSTVEYPFGCGAGIATLKESWGDWGAALTFKEVMQVPLPNEMISTNNPLLAGGKYRLAPTQQIFDASIHSEEENRALQTAITFTELAFTSGGMVHPSIIAARRTLLWNLLAPLVPLNGTIRLNQGGAGAGHLLGLAGRQDATEYINAWSLELLPCFPDAHITACERVLVKGRDVHLQVRWEGHWNGANFRSLKATQQQISLSLVFDYTVDAAGRIESISSLGNEERLLEGAMGIPSQIAKGRLFTTPLEGVGANAVIERHMPLVALKIVNVRGDGNATRGSLVHGRFAPGWKWSTHVKPKVGTEWCEHAHYGIVLSGRMHIAMSDGMTQTMGAGDTFAIPPGHDGWVVGDEECVMVDASGCSQHYGLKGGALTSIQAAGIPSVLSIRNFHAPDREMSVPSASMASVQFEHGVNVNRVIAEPGWRWSTHVRPAVNTPLCEQSHLGLLLRGKETIQLCDGTRLTIDASDGIPQMMQIPPHHDAWVEGDQIVEFIEFTQVNEE
jgi:hypothetical protein